MKRFIALAITALLALTLIACGGDDDSDSGDDGGSSDQPAATSDDSSSGDSSNDSSSSDDSSSDDSDSSGDSDSGDASEGAYAVVTIGDETWEFDLEASLTVCISMGGAIGAVGPAADGSEVSLDMDLPPENYEELDDDWEAPSIRVRDRVNERDFRAGDEVAISVFESAGFTADDSKVDSWSIDGASATGTATFLDMNAVQRGIAGGEAAEPVQGTFEVSCG